MRGITVLLLALALCSFACSDSQSTPKNVPSKPEDKKDSMVVAENTTSDKVATEFEAKRSAATHLALRNQHWGEPESIEDQGDKFFVFYKTPERERRLLGPRILVVRKSTGVVSFQKRR